MALIPRQWICRGEGCNDTSEEYIPDVQQWMNAIGDISHWMMTGAAAMTGLVICLSLLHLIFVSTLISDEKIRSELYWVVLMPPVIVVCGFTGMVLPRAALFLYAIALVYYMICIFVLVCLMNTLHGSRKSMCEKLMAKGERISIRIYPFACWLICFEDFLPTEENFRRFEVLVFQSPVVRIMLEILNITVFMELSSRKHMYFQISNFAAMISMFIGSYGSYVIVPVGASLLREYRFLLLFRIVDFCQLFWSVQKFVGDLCGIIDMVPTIAHDPAKLPSSAVAQFYICFLLCVEMLFVSLLSTFCFQPSRCAFFDKHRKRNAMDNANGECAEDGCVSDVEAGSGAEDGDELLDDDSVQQQQHLRKCLYFRRNRSWIARWKRWMEEDGVRNLYHWNMIICHLNVTKDGALLMDMLLRQHWNPLMTISTVLLSISSLLSDPSEHTCALDMDIEIIYRKDREQYNRNAREWTQKHAMK
ncbi:hypothetical protein niasHT_026970 [Heterodera trifolii]|uniref:UBC core domain-containing protein n=1 Tax=Heterodera trifolii TaxID=157864 RepID=A0ABD2KRP0_9BILA